MRYAIIGAGMAGLSCADALKAAGHEVALFDKGRGPGGRMSTRRMASPLGDVSFDHGAQYFTARDPAFRLLVDQWQDQGIIARWPDATAEAWVGVPGMNAVVRQMAASHDVAWGHHVTGLSRRHGGWWLSDESGTSGPFDAAVLAIPAEQAAPMLSLHDFAMARVALTARSQPCWTAMFVFASAIGQDAAVLRDSGPISWAARNSAKPGRGGPEAWVVQGSAPWSAQWLEHGPDEVSALLLRALAAALGTALPDPVAAAAHRWRYALTAGTGHNALWNQALGLGVCGDWLLGPRVECAWLSGRMLAERCLMAEHAAEPLTVRAAG